MFEPPEFGKLNWFQVRPLFEEYGCVWLDHPEMRWYEESWGALIRAGLADEETEKDEVVSKLRAIALLYMYLGFCRSLDEDRDPELSDLLYEMKIDKEYLLMLFDEEEHRSPVILEMEGKSDDEDSSDTIRERLEEVAFDVMRRQAGPIYDALIEHYGDVNYLFVSMWNSRVPLYEAESAAEVLCDALIEKQRAFAFVSDEMAHL